MALERFTRESDVLQVREAIEALRESHILRLNDEENQGVINHLFRIIHLT